MPPSTIPQAQVQAMIAELRSAGALHEEPIPSPAPPRRMNRLWKTGVGMLTVALVFGAGAGVLGRGLGLLSERPRPIPAPTAMVVSEPVKVAQAPAPAPVSVPPAPKPVTAPAATIRPAPTAVTPLAKAAVATPGLRPARAALHAPARPAKPRACLAGGPCTALDVATAEKRLASAYRSAQRAGVSKPRLAAAQQQWDTLKVKAQTEPRTAVAGYRKLSAELSRRPTAHKTKSTRPRRHSPPRDPPMIPFRRSR
jgi:hypothetical protein